MAPSAVSEPDHVVVHAGNGVIKRPILHGDAMKPTFTSIPQIDFTNVDSPNPADRQELALQVRKAFCEVGFMYAVNHGIDDSLQKEVLRVLKEFFALPVEEKMKIHVNKSATIKGYEAMLETRLDESTRGDVKEAFACGNDPFEPEQNAPKDLDLSQFPRNANQWPEKPPEFRRIMYEYNNACVEFGKRLMHIISMALGLEETYFDSMAHFPMSSMRALHYPTSEFKNDVGIGAHADYTWFTLVNQLEGKGGLEVLNGNGHWVPAPPIPNTLVVNVGDFLERSTNDIFVSTVHRVVNNTGSDRYSLVYFQSPSADATVGVIPQCISEDRPAKYEAVNAGDWNRQRLLRARYKHPDSIAARARGEI